VFVKIQAASALQHIYSQAFLKDLGSSAQLLTGFAKSPFPGLKIKDSFVEMFFSEIRPEYGCKI
jgi:hypothetical protein